MDKLYAFCGLDCAQCDAYKATQANDDAAKEAVARQWERDFHIPKVELSDVTCDGCTTSGKRLSGYCTQCKVRACAVAKGVINCAYCEDYATCEDLNSFLKNVPVAKSNLDQVHASL